MAFYQRFKLAPLKLTQRPDAAKCWFTEGSLLLDNRNQVLTMETVWGQNGSQVLALKNIWGKNFFVESSETTVVQDFFPDSPPIIDEPTHHELQSKANVRGWEQLRS